MLNRLAWSAIAMNLLIEGVFMAVAAVGGVWYRFLGQCVWKLETFNVVVCQVVVYRDVVYRVVVYQVVVYRIVVCQVRAVLFDSEWETSHYCGAVHNGKNAPTTIQKMASR